jgi:hypothetical protein
MILDENIRISHSFKAAGFGSGVGEEVATR